MERESAIREIRRRVKCTDYLTKSKSGLYCCPFCGSGDGPKETGGLKYYPDTNTWTCFACKGKGEPKYSGDVFDLYLQATGVDFNTALTLLAQEAGIVIDAPFSPLPENGPVERPTSAQNAQGNIRTLPGKETQENAPERPTAASDYTGYYRECMARLTDPAAAAYLAGRGISLATAQRYGLGYDPAADPANAPGGSGQAQHPCPRLIIPTSKAHYIARRIDGGGEYKKLNPKGSTPAIFNERALEAAQEVFITEGAFDALSVIEAGAAAIALNSTANAEALINRLAQRRTDAALVLCLDNDEAGKAATVKLAEGLRRLDISFIRADLCGAYKDPNEHLTGNRAAFTEAVAEAQRLAGAKPDNTAYYIDSLMATEIDRFRDDKKTGFPILDAQAGGLYAGLYVLAAISSLGKTSFALQLADQLAERGTDVLFFSLEQSRLELVSKSLARRTAQADPDKAVSSLSIRKGYLPQQVQEAAAGYKRAVADRMSVIEGNFACDISFIGDYIRRYIRRNGTRPVVFIDYLQILQPTAETRQRSAKDTVDSAVTELKRISREMELTVIVISSVNRANYLTPIDFESLKESGGIEFTADVVWGLQLQCLNDPLFSKPNSIKEQRAKVKEEKAANPRKIELVCLKNRYGVSSYSCFFDYFPSADLFMETDSAGVAFTSTPKAGRKL